MRAFVVRGFGKHKDSSGAEIDFDRVDAELITPALKECNLVGGTTGQIVEAGNIRVDMFALIVEADVVICDITVHNANVFYELGIRHALRKKHKAFPKAMNLDASSFVPAKITVVAVWDAVGSLGIPIYHAGAAIDLFRFSDTALSPNIKLGVHAVSLDEQRKLFEPTLWDANPNVTQALFPGDHCDVGGGYPDHGLSDGPLLWIVDTATSRCGTQVRAPSIS
jgi:hypothetical protein